MSYRLLVFFFKYKMATLACDHFSLLTKLGLFPSPFSAFETFLKGLSLDLGTLAN